ncbi:Lsr2 family protein [Streptomyces sp. NPDC102381]|uniref:histone-like nucleoid-structuring protein Lsr2 n=1 Tax=Streptomyces sp. NPDC102381 TaxID=3366164 RepID=UPI00381F3447
MAQKTIVIYSDDLTGSQVEDVTTHTFSLNGVNYEIDLASDSYDKLAEALGPFIKAGRKTGRGKGGSPRPRKGRGAAGDGGASAEEIRAWAKSRNIQVNERGRVPAAVREQYESAH